MCVVWGVAAAQLASLVVEPDFDLLVLWRSWEDRQKGLEVVSWGCVGTEGQFWPGLGIKLMVLR